MSGYWTHLVFSLSSVSREFWTLASFMSNISWLIKLSWRRIWGTVGKWHTWPLLWHIFLSEPVEIPNSQQRARTTPVIGNGGIGLFICPKGAEIMAPTQISRCNCYNCILTKLQGEIVFFHHLLGIKTRDLIQSLYIQRDTHLSHQKYSWVNSQKLIGWWFLMHDSQDCSPSPLLPKITAAASKQNSLDVLGLHGPALAYCSALLL